MRRKLSFVIFPPQEVQDDIEDKRLKVKSAFNNSDLSLINTAKFAIPFIYLGAVSEESKNAAIDAVESILPQAASFEISISRYPSYFYKYDKGGSLIFLDIQDKEKNLKSLHRILEKVLNESGFSPATHFTPHIPIAYLKKQRFDHEQMKLLDEISQIELSKSAPFGVNELSLVEQVNDNFLTPKYSLLKSYSFNK